jgi:sec-independent protein translocase protein TatC
VSEPEPPRRDPPAPIDPDPSPEDRDLELRRFARGDAWDDGSTDVEELPRMTLIQHLEELRGRILRSLAALLVGFSVCFFFAKPIFRFLQRPILAYLPEGKKLVFLKVTDPFALYMKVAALAGLFLVLPYILYQVWRFIAPGLYRHEKRYSVPFILFGSFFFLAGGSFAYYVAFPYAVQFLINLGEDFEPAITGPSYLSFLLTVILGMALMFELPVFILVLSQIGVVSPRFLLRQFRWAVLIIVAVAAVITPTPDIVTLSVFALPTIGLYLLGVGVAAVVEGQKADETGVFMTRVGVSVIVALHLAAAIWHGMTHSTLAVTLPPEKNLFVLVVIVILPVAAAILAWTRWVTLGIWLLVLSMLGALVFGVYHHYLVVSPDHVSHLPAGNPAAAMRFIWSAGLIAGLEAAAVLYGSFRLRWLRQHPH